MMVGLNANGWGPAAAPSLIHQAVDYVRIDTPSAGTVDNWRTAGVKVIADISGGYAADGSALDYNTGGVSALDPSAWATNAASWYQSLSSIDRSDVAAIEVLNEPQGSWFWGPNAEDQTNATAYAQLLKDVHNKFVADFGSNHPLILATWDYTWGSEVWGSDPNMNSYIDGVVVHPYGLNNVGTTASAQGNRSLVASAHSATGKPVYVTEAGWPTAVGQPPTGDSLQWTEQQQAENIYNFINWARSTGYVNAVMIFAETDYGTNMWYGVESLENSSGVSTIKPSFYALQEAAQGLPLTCSGC
jgi:hypothetical protein